ncbi:HigA family addiction module antitoxin [Mesorhizobium sp.]|uniref:HigA family addiction module antitoxin n=1 Tax=Mesorhizobium sp. TaxID=1871066 RepID=UPI000FE9ED26|nr:HigA family addiction module antitoxin [Mesorhizobium sp.]RWB65734.1 MAG: addiction module antidote protein, HigA family [Mesorhizobium sp.]RWB81638.1 MAG: addiction module antidote protein, HigA family [Mesorhizobium sp.]
MQPGEILREDIISELELRKSHIARMLGIARHTLYDILDETQLVTVAMALRFGKLFGNGPVLWLNLQRSCDLDQPRGTGRRDEAIPTLHAA